MAPDAAPAADTTTPATAALPAHRPIPVRARPARAGQRQTAQMTGEETRLRIIAAAIDTLNDDGITGASARSIARKGSFNQALIFYHFGSVEGLLLAAALSEGEKRSVLYGDRFGQVETLGELVAVARDVHAKEMAEGGPTVLTQLLAGAASSPTLAKGILDAMRPWMALVEQAVARVIAGTPVADLVPVADVAFAIASLFLGMELMTNLEQGFDRSDALFESIARVAMLIELLLRGGSPAAPPPR